MELSRTDCIFGFFFFSFSSFLLLSRQTEDFSATSFVFVIRNLWILKIRFTIFLPIIRYFTMQEENFCKGKMREKEKIFALSPRLYPLLGNS